jgi:hypothetical protein
MQWPKLEKSKEKKGVEALLDLKRLSAYGLEIQKPRFYNHAFLVRVLKFLFFLW